MSAMVSAAIRGSRDPAALDFCVQNSRILPMPAQYRLGLHEQQGVAPARQDAGQCHEQAAVERPEVWMLHAACSDDELLTKGSVLGDQLLWAAKKVLHEPLDHRRGTKDLSEHRPGRRQHPAKGGADAGSEDGEHGPGSRPDPTNLQDLFLMEFSTILRRTGKVATTATVALATDEPNRVFAEYGVCAPRRAHGAGGCDVERPDTSVYRQSKVVSLPGNPHGERRGYLAF